ncbi:MAG TPA: DUF2851 family protein [Ignavibacteria bacterium]|nr:DUF2851 family protein [Ignavibacteria bacterium]
MDKRIISEKFLCEIWEKHNFVGNLKTFDGKSIEVLSKGEPNKDLEGPDYLDAKIKIDNTTFSGDIEIDTEIGNWKNHNHHKNKKYNKVILHIVYANNTNQKFVTAENKRVIPSISLSEFITPNIKQSLTDQIKSDDASKSYYIRCAGLNNEVSEKFKENYLLSLGSKRFNYKKEKIFNRLKELAYLSQRELKEPIVNYDLGSELERIEFNYNDFTAPVLWEQLLYENVFTALGYSKNKENMNKLAKSVEIKLLRSIKSNSNLDKILEAILFSVSGLLSEVKELPDEETSVYIRELYELWHEHHDYDYGAKLHPTSWNFFRMRPQNFPTVRIAGGVKILEKILVGNLIHELIKLFETEKDEKQLRQKLRNNFIVKAEGYWGEHFLFDQPAKTKLLYLVGVSRADEIIINIILPFLSLYFEIFNKRELLNSVLNSYLNYQQAGKNKLVEDVMSSLKIRSDRSVIYQGILHLYWNYCNKNKCNICEIGKKVF